MSQKLHVKKGNDYIQLDAKRIKDNIRAYKIMTYNTYRRRTEFVPVDAINFTPAEDKFFEVVFENNLGLQRKIICSGKNQFYTTGKGYVAVRKLNKSTICIDDEERINVVISVEPTDETPEYFDIVPKYNGNFYCDGILMR